MFFTLAFLLLLAQAPDPVVFVEGRVVDAATEQPITGARVILGRVDRPGVGISVGLWEAKPSEGEPDPKANRLVQFTGDDGMFRFRVEAPAKFALFVDAKGFARTQTQFGPETTLSVEPGRPKSGIVLRMTRELSLSGRVIDGDTGEPVPNLAVRAHRYRITGGSGRILIPDGGSARTDAAGRFRLEGIRPGEYYLEAAQPLRAKIGKPTAVGDFRRDVRRAYTPSWYPGAERFAEAAPVTLVEGVAVDGIEIKTAQRRTAAIRGRVLGDREGEADLSLTRVSKGIETRGFEMVAVGKVQTGSAYEVDRLTPGNYYLLAEMPGATARERQIAVLPLEVADENRDGLDLHLGPTVTLRGTVRIQGRDPRQEEPALPVEPVRIGLSRALGMGIAGDPGPAVVESKTGSFMLEGVVADRYQLWLGKLPEGHKIAEVRYNHAVCPSGIFAIDPGAGVQRLDVTLAPADASISATVTDGSQPAAGATVLLVPDPVEDDAMDIGWALRKAQTDGDGRAAIGELLPGKYRLSAFPKDARWQEDPGLKHKLRSGQEVRVAPHQATMIELRTK